MLVQQIEIPVKPWIITAFFWMASFFASPAYAEISWFDVQTTSEAVEANRPQNLKNLIAAGQSIAQRNEKGETLLHRAASAGHLEVLQVLLDYGSGVDERDKSGRTPLAVAVQNRQEEAAFFLLERRANPNIRNLQGETPLVFARTPSLALLLLSRGANPNSCNHYGLTPLMTWVKRGATAEMLDLLIQYGADVNAADNRGHTALAKAAKYNQLDGIDLLIAAGANKNSLDRNGITPLMRAIFNRHYEAVDRLLSHGADLHIKTKQQAQVQIRTPQECFLFCAPTVWIPQGSTALQCAQILKEKGIEQLLLEYGAR